MQNSELFGEQNNSVSIVFPIVTNTSTFEVRVAYLIYGGSKMSYDQNTYVILHPSCSKNYIEHTMSFLYIDLLSTCTEAYFFVKAQRFLKDLKWFTQFI